MAVILFSCSHYVLFYPTGIPTQEGETCYLYQPIDKKGIATSLPDMYFCKDCELELRKSKVYLKGTNEEIK